MTWGGTSAGGRGGGAQKAEEVDFVSYVSVAFSDR